MVKKTNLKEKIHSEDLQEIIGSPPSWLLKRGISFILLIILLIIGLSVFIRYPEIIHVPMKFHTSNVSKSLISKANGNLSNILVKEGQWVEKNTDVAYLESIADQAQVIDVLNRLKKMRNKVTVIHDMEKLISPAELNLGELQNSYHNLYLAYLHYKAAKSKAILQKRKYVEVKIEYINDNNSHYQKITELLKNELTLAEAEYEFINTQEIEQEEAILLLRRQTIQEMKNIVIGKWRGLRDRNVSDIENYIIEEENKFYKSLNAFISEAENWKKQYVITTLSKGFLVYGDLLRENHLVKMGDILFYINADKEDYYGEILIPKASSANVKRNQNVLIKMRSYPYREYGYLKGRIDYISDIPIKDNLFFSKVVLLRTKKDSIINLKPTIQAEAEIIMEDQSIFNRIWTGLTKSIN